MRDHPVDPLFPTISQILPDQWIQELLDHIHELRKDSNDDHHASYDNDIASNSSVLFTNDQDYICLERYGRNPMSLSCMTIGSFT